MRTGIDRRTLSSGTSITCSCWYWVVVKLQTKSNISDKNSVTNTWNIECSVQHGSRRKLLSIASGIFDGLTGLPTRGSS